MRNNKTKHTNNTFRAETDIFAMTNVGYFLSPDCFHRTVDSVVPQLPMKLHCSFWQ